MLPRTVKGGEVWSVISSLKNFDYRSINSGHAEVERSKEEHEDALAYNP